MGGVEPEKERKERAPKSACRFGCAVNAFFNRQSFFFLFFRSGSQPALCVFVCVCVKVMTVNVLALNCRQSLLGGG